MHKKWSFLLGICFVNVNKPHKTADLLTFIKQIVNGKLHFFVKNIIGFTTES